MPGYEVDVIDIGLKLEDALAMGKRPESQTVESRLDSKVEAALTDVEREHFVGEERQVIKDGKRKTQWLVKRVELNDLSSPQLVEYVERKLTENGACPKVIPPPRALAARTERLYREEMRGWVENAVDEVLDVDKLKDKMIREFQERFKLHGSKSWVETGFKRDDAQSWRDAVKSTLWAAYDTKHKHGLQDAVREYILETVREDEGTQ